LHNVIDYIGCLQPANENYMASVKDVAALAGVSTATVSRTLSQSDKVAEETRERVMQAVKACGYRMNTAARQFRRQRTETVLVVVPDIGNPFFSNIVQGIETCAKKHNYRVLLGETDSGGSDAESYAHYMHQHHADGAILLTAEGIDNFFNEDADIPVVMACEYLPKSPCPTVRIDNAQAAEDAVCHLLGLGHKHIAFINGPANSPLSKDRLKGYRRALKAAGIEFDNKLIARGDYSPDSGYVCAHQLLALDEPPTAIFAASDPMAIGVLRAANERDIKIPQQLSLVGFDDIRFAEFMTPGLCTIHQPRELIGSTAMAQMLKLLDGETPEQDKVLTHQLVIRESTAQPMNRNHT
jgi:LacI family repressor for deo operon, udp, cdd, tsx, nupC, and nupG